MPHKYDNHSVRFRLPDGWTVTEDATEDGLVLTAAGEGAAYWSLSLLDRRPDPEHVLHTAVAAFRDVYPDLDEYPATAELSGRSAASRHVEFFESQFVNAAHLRAIRTLHRTIFVLFQATEEPGDPTMEILEAISASLRVEEAEFPEDEFFAPW